MATNRSKLADILTKVINKNVKDAGDSTAQEVRAGEWLAILEPILDAEYPDWRTIHGYV